MKHLMLFESYCILGAIESVTVTNVNGETVSRSARIDTGRYSSMMSMSIAEELKLPVVKHSKVWNTLGETTMPFVECQLNINGIEIKTIVGISDMSSLKHEILIGRRDIEMVDGVVDLKKDTILNNMTEVSEELPIDASEPLINVIMTEDDLDILSQTPNVTVDEQQPNIMTINQFMEKN